MPIELICLDADDTLWHNMRHFDAAERALRELLAPFADAGITQERLEQVAARNLPIYGYGAKSFTLFMIETAVELCGGRIPASLLQDILASGRKLLSHPVELLPGAREALDALAARAPLVLVTKGDLLHQEAKIAASGIGDRFASIEIVSEKKPDTLRRLFARHRVPPERCLMAGDSVRSDVLPALEADAWAAHVPHEIVWFHERANAPLEHPRFRQFEHLSQLPAWIDALG